MVKKSQKNDKKQKRQKISNDEGTLTDLCEDKMKEKGTGTRQAKREINSNKCNNPRGNKSFLKRRHRKRIIIICLKYEREHGPEEIIVYPGGPSERSNASSALTLKFVVPFYRPSDTERNSETSRQRMEFKMHPNKHILCGTHGVKREEAKR